MKVLSLNIGSSSLKFKLFEMPEERLLISGRFEKIGFSESFYVIQVDDNKIKESKEFNSHKEVVELLVEKLIELNIISSIEEIRYIGHRVVHGGEEYSDSVILNEDIIKTIEKYNVLAPLHNPINILGIRTVQKILPDSINVAVFDTAFHQTVPMDKFLYAIPYEYYEKYRIRKYGFHGISHEFLMLRAKELGYNNIITCHLGNGCSISAIKENKCISNSFGFSPLSGLMMGTRSGDVDPFVISFLMENEDKNIDEVLDILNKKSGMLGISGHSHDFRDIKAAMDLNDKRAILAHDMFCDRVVSFISYYYVLMGQVDAIVFSGGIGEMSGYTREKIINKLAPLGIYISNNESKDLNIITTNDSKVKGIIIFTDEELMIAKEVYRLVERGINV